MSATIAAYERDVESASAALQDLAYLVTERDNARRAGAASASDVAGRARGAMTKVDRLVDALDRQLKAIEADPDAHRLTQREALRKRDALRKLTSERARLKSLERASVAAAAGGASALSDKDALLGGSSRGGGGTPAPREATPDELQQRTLLEIKQQDLQLDSLSKGLDGLKQMGLAISDETSLHMKLIDNLEESVDKGDTALKREAARAEHITQDTRTCWLYVLICLLLVVLIALVVIGFGHVKV